MALVAMPLFSLIRFTISAPVFPEEAHQSHYVLDSGYLSPPAIPNHLFEVSEDHLPHDTGTIHNTHKFFNGNRLGRPKGAKNNSKYDEETRSGSSSHSQIQNQASPVPELQYLEGMLHHPSFVERRGRPKGVKKKKKAGKEATTTSEHKITEPLTEAELEAERELEREAEKIRQLIRERPSRNSIKKDRIIDAYFEKWGLNPHVLNSDEIEAAFRKLRGDYINNSDPKLMRKMSLYFKRYLRSRGAPPTYVDLVAQYWREHSTASSRLQYEERGKDIVNEEGGGVPPSRVFRGRIRKGSDGQKEVKVVRTPKSEVVESIVNDLEKELDKTKDKFVLSDMHASSMEEKTRSMLDGYHNEMFVSEALLHYFTPIGGKEYAQTIVNLRRLNRVRTSNRKAQRRLTQKKKDRKRENETGPGTDTDNNHNIHVSDAGPSNIHDTHQHNHKIHTNIAPPSTPLYLSQPTNSHTSILPVLLCRLCGIILSGREAMMGNAKCIANDLKFYFVARVFRLGSSVLRLLLLCLGGTSVAKLYYS